MPRYDTVALLVDQEGRPLTSVDGLISARPPSNVKKPVTLNLSAAGQIVIPAQGVGISIVIRKVIVGNVGVEQVVSLREGVGGYAGWTNNLAPDGGGYVIDFGGGWVITPNAAFVADAQSASVYVNVTDWGVQ